MGFIPFNLKKRLREVLLNCPQLENDRQLRAAFVDERISCWRDNLPTSSELNNRVALLIDYLYNKFNDAGENALVLLLHVFASEIAHNDAFYTKLVNLAADLEKFFTSKPEQPPDDYNFVRQTVLRPQSPPTPSFVNYTEERRALFEGLRACRDTGGVYMLIGQGGVGKTALAAQLAQDLTLDFDNNVLWIPLKCKPKAETIWINIARAFGISPSSDPAIDACKVLYDYHPLLVIDNAENALEIASIILNRCSAITAVLVTSSNRKIMKNNYLDVFELDSLPRDEAIQFVAERIKNPLIKKIEEYRASINTLCDLLGDLPLALEIAAHYMSVYEITPKEYVKMFREEPLEERLKRCFDLSYKRLKKDAQFALVSLALDDGESSALEAITVRREKKKAKERNRQIYEELVSHCLAKRTGTDEFPRLALHPIVRRYAKEQLRIRHARIRARLTNYYLAYAEAHFEPTKENHDALETEHYNLLAAMQHAYETKKWSAVRRFAWVLCDSINSYLRKRGHWQELRDRLEQAIQAAEVEKDREDTAAFTSQLAAVHYLTGDKDIASQEYERALTIFDKLNDLENVAVITHRLGQIATDKGEYSKAYRYYEKALGVFRGLDEQTNIAISLYHLGVLARKLGNGNEAIDYLQQSRGIYQNIKDEKGISDVLHEMGIIAHNRGELAEAEKYLKDSLSIAESLGEQDDIALTSDELGQLMRDKGNYTEAESYSAKSLDIAKRLGMSELSIIQDHHTELMKDIRKHNEQTSPKNTVSQKE